MTPPQKLDLKKIVVKGCLEFGSKKAFDAMLIHFGKRHESYYKNDTLLKEPSYFVEETNAIIIERTTFIFHEKTFKNTVALLNELNSYSVAGYILLNVTEPDCKKVLRFEKIVPNEQKAIHHEYNQGVNFLKIQEVDKAIMSLTSSIEKFEHHFLALERRAYAFLLQEKMADAYMDIAKSLKWRKSPEAFYTLAELKMAEGKFQEAVESLQLSIDNALPYQPIFWTARRLKGICHYKLGEFETASKELKYFTKREYSVDDPNFALRADAWHAYAKSLEKIGDKKNAELALSKAIDLNKLDSRDFTLPKYMRIK